MIAFVGFRDLTDVYCIIYTSKRILHVYKKLCSFSRSHKHNITAAGHARREWVWFVLCALSKGWAEETLGIAYPINTFEEYTSIHTYKLVYLIGQLVRASRIIALALFISSTMFTAYLSADAGKSLSHRHPPHFLHRPIPPHVLRP